MGLQPPKCSELPKGGISKSRHGCMANMRFIRRMRIVVLEIVDLVSFHGVTAKLSSKGKTHVHQLVVSPLWHRWLPLRRVFPTCVGVNRNSAATANFTGSVPHERGVNRLVSPSTADVAKGTWQRSRGSFAKMIRGPNGTSSKANGRMKLTQQIRCTTCSHPHILQRIWAQA